MKRTLTVIAATVMLMTAGASVQAAFIGETIGINLRDNYNADELIEGSETAGVEPQQNWTNIRGVDSGASNLQDSSGSVTTADVTLSNVDGDYRFGTNLTGADGDLMRGGAYWRDTTLTNVVTFNEIPSEFTDAALGYDVIVYSEQGDDTGRVSEFVIDDESIFLETVNLSNFQRATGTGTADSNRLGNYVRFEGLTAVSFTLEAKAHDVDTFEQTAISGIQLASVEIPEPSTALLLLLGATAVLGRRPRRK